MIELQCIVIVMMFTVRNRYVLYLISMCTMQVDQWRGTEELGGIW